MLLHAGFLLLTTVARIARRDDDWQDDDDSANCVKAVPGPNGNVPITACNSYYNYDPQFAPAVAVAVIFGVFTAVHLVEGVLFKKRYTWVLTMGALWETIAFAIHAAGSRDQQQIAYATVWNVLFLLAPLWINAFAYMTFARMVHFYLPRGKVAGLRAGGIARWFVLADVVSFVVQAVGGIMASPSSSAEIVKVGLDIYLGGMGLQQGCILVFVGLMYRFQRECGREGVAGDGKRSWRSLLFALYGVLVCITIRIIFRIAEFAGGVTPSNPVPFHEQYTYALDCFPMMVALLILAVWHPGRYLVGPDSEFPRLSRREKKERKREAKAAVWEEKEARKQAKREAKAGRREAGGSGDDVV
ncbi:RTA1 like protein-domain-containing protein [Staphylotrichum tortipilum]|uniref:RTA1 like protein-domain-containing protein n=1 Tax=Staphylotrichum tortipilum TaxID=2831512 RepID=A0AAN6MV25_9PEZI|nr:RTA1 like protein-domain-containing protein [Staphylotrichum longicolle]